MDVLYELIVKQAPTFGGFICENCRNYLGGVRCANDVFISTQGANMTGCTMFWPKAADDAAGSDAEVKARA